MTRNSTALEELAELGGLLSLALEKEFHLLSDRSVELLEDIQIEKVKLLEKISVAWGELEADGAMSEASSYFKDNASLDDVKNLLRACQEKHQRNDILLRRQIDEVKTLLNTLTMRKSNNNPIVYNKLGEILS